MHTAVRARLMQVGSFVLAGLLLYFSLRGIDLTEIGDALADADYRWVLPLIAVALLSHLIRAWRWLILVDTLNPNETQERVPLRTAFYSVMIGYMVNYAAPRLGEVARSANLARQSRYSFSSLMGTVVVERIIDVIVLAGALVSVFVMLSEKSSALREMLVSPDDLFSGTVVAFVVLGLGGCLAALAVLVWAIRREGSLAHGFWHQRVGPVVASFKQGMASVLHVRRRGALVVSTIGIWICYMLMAWLPFIILGMAEPYGITAARAWEIMIIGSLGIVIPSPGGTGSYHFITIQTLTALYAVQATDAATYAVLAHASQLVLYTVVGALSMVLQGASMRVLRQTAGD